MTSDLSPRSPFFTVVIPTYNRAELLRQALQSVFDQTFTDFEVIVIDDYSTDHTRSVAESFSDPRLTYVMNDRSKGGGGARNVGIFRAQGQWVAFLDDDDVWLPEKLEQQYQKIIEVGDSVGFIYTSYAKYDFARHRVLHISRPVKAGWIMQDLFYRNYIGGFFSVAIKTDILKAIGGLDERFPAMQDRDLYMRVTQLTQVAYVNLPLVLVRTSNTDRISKNAYRRMRGGCLFREKYWEYIRPHPRLRHRINASIFMSATQVKDWHTIRDTLPWTLAGLIIDPRHFWKVLRITSHGIRQKLRISDGHILGWKWRKPAARLNRAIVPPGTRLSYLNQVPERSE